MYDAYRYQKYLSLAFFISLIMIGQMILLNLFLAILLENFNIGEKAQQGDNEKTQYLKRFKNWISNKFNCQWIKRLSSAFKARKDKYKGNAVFLSIETKKEGDSSSSSSSSSESEEIIELGLKDKPSQKIEERKVKSAAKNSRKDILKKTVINDSTQSLIINSSMDQFRCKGLDSPL